MVGTPDIEQRRALDEIVERRGADLDGGGIHGEARLAFCRAVEIDQPTVPELARRFVLTSCWPDRRTRD